ncbi:MAG: beta galactosidase jelly roll domain-containing protein, partial [Clostridia bacterium]|nr:beta galactosidase jelly roll domain-containing protein [Clostridia bacterium]
KTGRFSIGSIVKKFTKSAQDTEVVMAGAVDGEKKIGLLVDTMGRVNYGENMIDRKGFSDIYIANQRQMGYDVWTLPLDNLEKLTYKPLESFNKDKGAMFYKGTFKADSNADCFVHLDGFQKGYVFVNGFNLGRYWEVGPQKSLYLPGCLLKEENEIVVLETMGMKKPEITITDKHDLG